MTVEEQIHEMGVKARAAATALRAFTTAQKNAALTAIADALDAAKPQIDAANAEDVAAAQANGLAPALVDRLTLTPARFKSMVDGVRYIVELEDPVGADIWTRTRPSGISIRKVREPFGVVAVVFESRPNVFVDTAALCLKTSNAIILRGGKEALRSNAALNEAVRAGLAKAGLPADAVQLVPITDHAAVPALVRSVGLVDVAIPRGGERLIRAMCEAALIPVLKHYKGVCHVYVDDAADLDMALKILDNAKVQRPSACNAAEHDVDEAIAHVNAYGSHHSDCIVTNDAAHAAQFLRDVDSAAVYHNVSTRFTDGAEFGMGAEIGISTDKLHARGPMGLEELTTYKYVVTGDGVVRS